MQVDEVGAEVISVLDSPMQKRWQATCVTSTGWSSCSSCSVASVVDFSRNVWTLQSSANAEKLLHNSVVTIVVDNNFSVVCVICRYPQVSFVSFQFVQVKIFFLINEGVQK